MDSADQLRVYLNAVETAMQAINALRATHHVYASSNIGEILPKHVIRDLEDVSLSLSNYVTTEEYV